MASSFKALTAAQCPLLAPAGNTEDPHTCPKGQYQGQAVKKRKLESPQTIIWARAGQQPAPQTSLTGRTVTSDVHPQVKNLLQGSLATAWLNLDREESVLERLQTLEGYEVTFLKRKQYENDASIYKITEKKGSKQFSVKVHPDRFIHCSHIYRSAVFDAINKSGAATYIHEVFLVDHLINGYFFIIYNYLEGVTLKQALDQGMLSRETAFRKLIELERTINSANASLLMRCLTNYLLLADGRLVLTDWNEFVDVSKASEDSKQSHYLTRGMRIRTLIERGMPDKETWPVDPEKLIARILNKQRTPLQNHRLKNTSTVLSKTGQNHAECCKAIATRLPSALKTILEHGIQGHDLDLASTQQTLEYLRGIPGFEIFCLETQKQTPITTYKLTENPGGLSYTVKIHPEIFVCSSHVYHQDVRDIISSSGLLLKIRDTFLISSGAQAFRIVVHDFIESRLLNQIPQHGQGDKERWDDQVRALVKKLAALRISFNYVYTSDLMLLSDGSILLREWERLFYAPLASAPAAENFTRKSHFLLHDPPKIKE